MRTILFSILFCTSLVCFGQLSDDTVTKMLLAQCKRDSLEECIASGELLKTSIVFEKKEEVFAGYFPGVRLYLLTFVDKSGAIGSHKPDWYPALYAVDTSGGIVLSFRDNRTFASFINNSTKPLANLDKVYLYQCLYSKVFIGGSFDGRLPSDYPKEIYINSVFAQDEKLKRFYYLPWMAINNDRAALSNSTARRIVMYLRKRRCDLSFQTVTYRHQFRFDESDNMVSVESDVVSDK